MNFVKLMFSQGPGTIGLYGCNGSNDCGYGELFDKSKNTQMHGKNQKRDSNPGSCQS